MDKKQQEVELLRESVVLIKKDFLLEEDFSVSTENPEKEVLKYLTRVVKYLLDNDFNRLLNSLYRIDVSESKVNEIIELSGPDDLPETLAEAILEREKQKAEFRIRYRN